MKPWSRDAMVLSLCLIVALGGLYFWVRSLYPARTVSLRITAGDSQGLRHQLALELAKEASKEGIQLEVVPTDGSAVALQWIESRRIDLALVQGGLSRDAYRSIRQITPLHMEPLHLLVKPPLFESIHERGFQAMSGHRINLGAPGSGTQLLATEVLRFVGVCNESSEGASDCLWNHLTYSELQKSSYDELPDAVFTVSTLPSPLADALIDRHGFQLVPLPFGDAIAQQSFLELGTNRNAESICKRNVYSTIIPAWTYSVQKKVPSSSLASLGTRLLLVGHERVPAELIQRFLDRLYRSELIQIERPVLDASLLELATEFPMHAGSEQYRQRSKPIIAGDVIDYMEKLLAIGATVAGGIFFAVQWLERSRRRRRQASFTDYMERVMAIEAESFRNESAAHLNLPRLIQLQANLSELKADAVRKFAAGKLEGEGLVNGFLALVNDARNQLTRLILHERENIEGMATRNNASSEDVWRAQFEPPQSTHDV
jgi:TRAP-type uncharacterized transport system substrate-binding protein